MCLSVCEAMYWACSASLSWKAAVSRLAAASEHGGMLNLENSAPLHLSPHTQTHKSGFVHIGGLLKVDIDQTVGVCSRAKVLERTSV